MRKFIVCLAALLFGAPFAFGQAPQLGAGQVMGNSTAAQRPARAESLTAMFDRAFCGTNNSAIVRAGGTWACGTVPVAAGGTNCSVASGTCVDNISGFASTGIMSRTGAGAYSFSTLSALIDVIGSTRGSVLYRGASGWAALTPGTSGFVLTSGGAGADPAWVVSSVGVSSLNTQTGALVQWTPPQGRITLNSNTPVMTASYAAQTTVYYTSAGGGKNVPVFDGTAVKMYQLCAANTVGACELSVAMGANFTTNSNFDGFVSNNGASGNVLATTGSFCFGPAWSSDTVRGTGAGTSELESIDGLPTNKVSMTCRYANASTFTCAVHQCTYVGTMRTGSAGQSNYVFGGSGSGGVAANFQIWNMYNRVTVTTRVIDIGAGYNYSSATIRQARASAGNQISFIRGVVEDGVPASMAALIITAAASGNSGQSGIGLNSTASYSTKGYIVSALGTGGFASNASGSDVYVPRLGTNVLSLNENGDGATSALFDADGLSYLSATLVQ